jgi:hypothetical protein
MKPVDIDVKVVGQQDPTVEARLRGVKIDRIYSEAHKTFLPPFRKVDAITVFGKSMADGDPVSRTYSAR